MNCPPEIASIISKILQHGILQLRNCSWNNYSDVAQEIGDHLHNLPVLLAQYRPELLTFYWDVERSAFLSSVDESISRSYQSYWDQLEPHVPASALSETSG